jgi:uncharacterized protein (DUF2141 family)
MRDSAFSAKALLRFAMLGLLAPVCAHAGAVKNPGSATLTVRVEGVSAKGGILRLGLYDAKGYPDNDSTPVAAADVPAGRGEAVIVLSGIRPGIYAIETFQDINANGKMDTSWLGLPEEPFGFSRDARPHFSKPRFQAVAFPVGAGENRQTVRLQDSISLIAFSGRPPNGF